MTEHQHEWLTHLGDQRYCGLCGIVRLPTKTLVSTECRHVGTVYDERQGALWCKRCGGWVLADSDGATDG